MNLGIDFGSSFSEFAIFNQNNGEPEALQLEQNGSVFVPTIACAKDAESEITTGCDARRNMRKNKYLRFRACKMLLNAKPEEWSRHDSYSETFPPERIARKFLTDQIERALDKSADESIDRLVICVPEVWAKGIREPDPKDTLYQICTGLECVSRVSIVTEPEAASAYSAYNYRRESKDDEDYHGMFLIIDYGGGTLDITLTQVDDTVVEGKNTVRITTRARGGKGENHDGQIGVGGVAYMSRVAEIALCASGAEPALPDDPARLADRDRVMRTGSFSGYLLEVEDAIIGGSIKLKNRMNRYKTNPARMADDTDVFDTVTYGPDEDDVPITYAMLYSAYREIVQSVLREELDRIRPALEAYISDPLDMNRTDFKVILVGGFGKFAMVEDQVYRYFHITNARSDNRIDRTINANRESAIAFGAALIADNRIVVRKTAPQSLGVVGLDAKGRKTFHYAITFGQVMESGQVYYIREDPRTDRPNDRVIKTQYNPVESCEFAINDTDDVTKAYCHRMNAEYWERLKNIPAGSCALGFRIDDAGVIWFVVSEYDGQTRTAGSIIADIRLDSFERMFLSDGVTLFDEQTAITKSN